MRAPAGRALQILGLSTVVVGLLVGISLSNVRMELVYLAVGVALFYGGRLIEGRK